MADPAGPVEPGWLDLPSTIEGPEGLQLRRVTPELAELIEEQLNAELGATERSEMFRYYTRSIFPLRPFVEAPGRVTYALFRGEELLAQTSVYDADPGQRHVTLGFTYVLPAHRGKGYNPVLKQLLFRELASYGVRRVWFRMDRENRASQRGVERAGAVFSHVDDAARVYPDGRVSESLYFRRELLPPDWVFAASNGFAVRVGQAGELEALLRMAVEQGPSAGVEWVQVQHATEPGVYLAFDLVEAGECGTAGGATGGDAGGDSGGDAQPGGSAVGEEPQWRVSASEAQAEALGELAGAVVLPAEALRALARVV